MIICLPIPSNRLGEKLRGMLDANVAVAPLERLDREEFVLNTEIRDTQLQRNHEQVKIIYIYIHCIAEMI